MHIEFSLEVSDYVDYQMWVSGTSPEHLKRRNRNRLLVFVLYIILGAYTYYQNKNLLVSGVFVLVAFLWYLFYPKYSKWFFSRVYKRHIEATKAKSVGHTITLDINQEGIIGKEDGIVSNVPKSDLDQLIILPKQYLLQLENGATMILPRQAVDNATAFESALSNLGMAINDQRQWQWA